MGNKAFLSYDKKGNITGSINCSPKDVQANMSPDKMYVEGVGDPHKHKVVDGKIVDKTETEINNEKSEKELQRQQRREQILVELRVSLHPEIDEVDPNVISLLKKLNVIPQDL